MSLFAQTRPQIISGSILSRLDYTCVSADISSMEPPTLMVKPTESHVKLMENDEKTMLFDEKTLDSHDSLFENLGTTEAFLGDT